MDVRSFAKAAPEFPATLQRIDRTMLRLPPNAISFILTLQLLCATALSQTHLQNFSSYAVDGRSVIVHVDTSTVRFIFYQSDIVRVDYLPLPSSLLDSSYVVVQDTSSAVAVEVTNTDTSLSLSTSSLTITCSKTPFRVSYRTSSSTPLLSEGAAGGFFSSGYGRGVSFLLGANDHFYGTGERGTSLDKRGEQFDSYNDAFYGYSGALPRMNINIPFLASTNGYGLYFDNTYRGTYDLGVSDPSRFVYTASGGELSYYLIVAPTIPAQLERYTWLTGRQPLPPRWAFGYLQSKFGYQTQTEATNIVQMLRSEHIPCDGIILDLYWYNQMGDLAWNSAPWPSPSSMMTDFRRQGIKTIVITEPYVTSLSSNYAEGSANGYFGKVSNGQTYSLSNWWSCNCNAALVDFTNPAARAWWWSKHPAFLGSDSGGVAGLWTDLGEPERHPSDMQQFLGSAAKIHNMYNLLWAKTVFEGFNALRPGQRTFNLTRSGFAGIQRYGVIPWSGDVANTYTGLAAQLPMLLNMGMSGLAYHNSDIGGFCCGSTPAELYIRWMQYGAFCPVMRAHGTGRSTEPWGYGAQAEAIARSMIELRYRLLPYTYALAFENYRTGMPLARPLLFDDPTDAGVLSNASTYLWGNDILVSPVVTSRGNVSPGDVSARVGVDRFLVRPEVPWRAICTGPDIAGNAPTVCQGGKHYPDAAPPPIFRSTAARHARAGRVSGSRNIRDFLTLRRRRHIARIPDGRIRDDVLRGQSPGGGSGTVLLTYGRGNGGNIRGQTSAEDLYCRNPRRRRAAGNRFRERPAAPASFLL